MAFLKFAELAIGLLAVVVVYTQLIAPFLRGTTLLPWLRREAVAREEALRVELEAVKQKQVEQSIEDEIKSRSETLTKGN
jgi:hypothetical protein